MKFLVDAQLPKRLADYLAIKGLIATHTLDLPDKNATPDSIILQFAIEKDFVVITKDTDFLDSYLLNNRPKKLILVKTGNISNDQLINLFDKNLKVIVDSLKKFSLIEIHRENIIIHSN